MQHELCQKEKCMGVRKIYIDGSFQPQCQPRRAVSRGGNCDKCNTESFCANFLFCQNDTEIEKSVLLWVEHSTQNSIISMWQEMSTRSSLCSNYRFTSLKRCFNSKCTVWTSPSQDHNKSFLKKTNWIELPLQLAWIHLCHSDDSLKCGGISAMSS